MAMTVTIGKGYTIEMRRDAIDYHMASVPDTRWIFRDTQGHWHYWQKTEERVSLDSMLPTLELIIDEEGDDEYPGRSHWACTLCGENIIPGTKSEHKTFPGLESCEIKAADGEIFSLSDFEIKELKTILHAEPSEEILTQYVSDLCEQIRKRTAP